MTILLLLVLWAVGASKQGTYWNTLPSVFIMTNVHARYRNKDAVRDFIVCWCQIIFLIKIFVKLEKKYEKVILYVTTLLCTQSWENNKLPRLEDWIIKGMELADRQS